MRKCRVRGYSICTAAACVLSQSPLSQPVRVFAEELSFEGTTQIDTVSSYLDVDTFAVELTVEEVYAESGNAISVGDPILKLTDESYEEALAYYEAAMIRADNELTNTQMEYDQGILEAKADYETVIMSAEQADFVLEYQQAELETTLAEHEEILEELEERIAELEAGIAAGSYDSSSSSGSGGGSGSGGASGGKRGETEAESEFGMGDEKQTESEGKRTEETETNASEQEGTDAPEAAETSGSGETESSGSEAAETDAPKQTEASGSEGIETDAPKQTESSGSEAAETDASEETETDGSGETAGENGNSYAAQVESLKLLIEEETAQYDAAMAVLAERLEQYLTEAAEEGGEESGAGAEVSVSADEISALAEQLQTSIDGDDNVRVNLKNVQENLETVPESVMEVVKLAYPDYEKYIELLQSCVDQIDEDISVQEAVKSVIAQWETQNSQESDGQESGEEGQEEAVSELRSLLMELSQIGQERNELYMRLIAVEEEKISDLEKELKVSGAENGNQSGSENQEGSGSQSGSENQEGNGSQSGNENQEGSGSQSGDESQEGSGAQSGGEGQEESGAQSGGEGQGGDGSVGNETLPGSESETQSGDGTRDEGETQANDENQRGGLNSESGAEDGSGQSAQEERSGDAAGSRTGSDSKSSSFGDTQAAGASGGASGGGTVSGGLSSGGVSSSGDAQMSVNQTLTEADISLFGGRYDLTQVENLIAREPSDSDSAQELADQLEESKYTVETQYAELVRDKTITELQIQYTRDIAVIQGKLAEITYRQELEEWEETLAEAKSAKAELEEQKAVLDSMTDGMILADKAGTVASLEYEEGDVLSSRIPIISYYNRDVVTIALEVAQEDIARISVGDTVEVTLAGRMILEGTISQKKVEPESGTSRTTVNYEATVSLDNSDGFLSAGTAAVVTITTAEGMEEEDE